MTLDVNRIIDKLNAEWANDAVVLRKRLAILSEENERLKEENKQLKDDTQAKEELKEQAEPREMTP